MKRILVWDAPNMDMQLGEVYGRIPAGRERPNMGCIMNWLVQRAEGDEVIACVFVNVSVRSNANPKFHGWLRYLSSQGFSIFAKRKDIEGTGDIDDNMVAFIRERWDDELSEVVFASHDAACFGDLCGELANKEVAVVVLGFSELLNGFDEVEQATFIDLETLPGVFPQSLPRHINIWNLPPDGTLFPPSGPPLSTLQKRIPAKRVNARKSAASVTPSQG